MTDTFGGWSPTGVASLVTIVVGILLLVMYAMQRGLVRRELDGTDESAAAMAADDPTAPRAAPRRANRSLGAIGAVLLVVGLGLGVLSAVGGWGSGTPAAGGPSGNPDCAQGWNGCPKDSPKP